MASPGNRLSTAPPDRGAIATSSGAASTHMRQWMRGVQRVLAPGVNGTFALAKLTSGGANGSVTFANGVLTAFTPPS